jgi:hypothetical protein
MKNKMNKKLVCACLSLVLLATIFSGAANAAVVTRCYSKPGFGEDYKIGIGIHYGFSWGDSYSWLFGNHGEPWKDAWAEYPDGVPCGEILDKGKWWWYGFGMILPWNNQDPPIAGEQATVTFGDGKEMTIQFSDSSADFDFYILDSNIDVLSLAYSANGESLLEPVALGDANSIQIAREGINENLPIIEDDLIEDGFLEDGTNSQGSGSTMGALGLLYDYRTWIKEDDWRDYQGVTFTGYERFCDHRSFLKSITGPRIRQGNKEVRGKLILGPTCAQETGSFSIFISDLHKFSIEIDTSYYPPGPDALHELGVMKNYYIIDIYSDAYPWILVPNNGHEIHTWFAMGVKEGEQPTDELKAEAGGPYHGEIGERITFQGFASGGAEPYSWHWDFGDGKTSDLVNPTHVYDTDTSRDYTVTLTVTDSEGTIADDTAKVYIAGFTDIELTPENHDFGNIHRGNCSQIFEFTLNNIGSESINVGLKIDGADPKEFKIVSIGGNPVDYDPDHVIFTGLMKPYESIPIGVQYCPRYLADVESTAVLYAFSLISEDGMEISDSSDLYGTCDPYEDEDNPIGDLDEDEEDEPDGDESFIERFFRTLELLLRGELTFKDFFSSLF